MVADIHDAREKLRYEQNVRVIYNFHYARIFREIRVDSSCRRARMHSPEEVAPPR